MLISVGFIVKTLLSFDVDFKSLWQPQMLLTIFGLIFAYALTLFSAAAAWRDILKFLSGREIVYGEAFAIYTKANLGKYLPGNVLHYANRQVFGAQLGLSQIRLLLATMLEIVYSLGTAFVFGLTFAGDVIAEIYHSYLPHFNPWLAAISLCVIAFAALTGLYIALRKKAWFNELLALAKTRAFLLLSLKLIALYSANLLVFGLMQAILINFYTPLSIENAILVFLATTVSWLVGTVTPGAPGGIGVREWVFSLMLQGMAPMDIILLAAVIQRIIGVISELVCFAAGVVWTKKRHEGRAAHAGE